MKETDYYLISHEMDLETEDEYIFMEDITEGIIVSVNNNDIIFPQPEMVESDDFILIN